MGIGPDFIQYLDPDSPYVEEINDESQLHRFTKSLVERGYSQSEIHKIQFDNMYNFISEIL